MGSDDSWFHPLKAMERGRVLRRSTRSGGLNLRGLDANLLAGTNL